MNEYDGSYYAIGGAVYRRPERKEGGSIQFGFAVCTLCDGVSSDGAQEIADALNERDERLRMNEILSANRERDEA